MRRGMWTVKTAVSRAFCIAIATCRLIVVMVRTILLGSAEAGRATAIPPGPGETLIIAAKIQLRTMTGVTIGDAERSAK